MRNAVFFPNVETLLGVDSTDKTLLDTFKFEIRSLRTASNLNVFSYVFNYDEANTVLFCPMVLEAKYNEYGDTIGFELMKYLIGSDDLVFTLNTSLIESSSKLSDKYLPEYKKAVNAMLTAEEKVPTDETQNVVHLNPRNLH